MNKKIFLGLFATSAMMLGTACSSEDLIEQGGGNTATVSFTLSTEDAAQSRNISDGTTATKLYYAVYDKDGVLQSISNTTGVECTDLLTGHSIDVKLVKGQQYTVAFWAQANGAYVPAIDDNKFDIPMNYSGANNNENRDAFFKTETFIVTGDDSREVVLTRPFAQVNVGTTDYTAAKNAGFEVVQSKVTIAGAATTLNVLDGTVSGEATVTYTYAALPSETLTVDGQNYTWLSMCYVLPGEAEASTTVDAEFTFANERTSKEVVLENGLEAMPIQRNFRTNILGQLLTDDLNFVVKIDKNFQNPDYNIDMWDGETILEPALSEDGTTYLVSKAAHWAWLAGGTSARSNTSNALSKNVKIMSDIDFCGHTIVPIRPMAAITIDGNGKTFSNVSYDFYATASPYNLGLISMELFPAHETLTIKNLNFKKVSVDNKYTATDNGYAGVIIGDVQNGATVNIEGVTIKDSNIKGLQSVGTIVGLLPSRSTVNIRNTTVEGNTLSNYKKENESGYVCGLVGKVAGTLNVASDVVVNNNTITAFYAVKRGAGSIDAISAIRDNGVINCEATAGTNTITRTPINVEADLFINTVEDLQNFAANYAAYNYKVVALNNDLDLTGVDWTPIGGPGADLPDPFYGTFEGCGNTIKNLTIVEKEDADKYDAVGFFGWLEGSIKNVNFVDASVKGHHYVGVAVGYLVGNFGPGLIENVTVTGATVESSYLNDDRDGDKAGIIVGYINDGLVKNCKATNGTVKAQRDAGQLIGCCTTESVYSTFSGNTAVNVTVEGAGSNNRRNEIIGRIN